MTATTVGQCVSIWRDARRIRSAIERVRHSERKRAIHQYGERPTSTRTPIEAIVTVTSAFIDGQALIVPAHGRSQMAFTKTLSVHGVCFAHDEALRTRQAIVTFELIDGEAISLLADIKWTRAPRDCPEVGGCISGGTLLGVTEAPDIVCRPEGQ